MTRFDGDNIKYLRSSSSPSGYSQRTVDTPWVNTPVDDELLATKSMLEETLRYIREKEERAREAQNTPGIDKFGIVITRSERNKGIAGKLGIDADQMAERLARPDMNQGTLTRLPEEEFDALMEELDLSPGEARARFKGTHWS